MEFYIIEAMLGAFMFGIGGMLFKLNAHAHGDDNYFFLGLYTVGALCFLIDGYEELGNFGGIAYYIMAAIVGLGSAGGNYTFSQGMRLGPAGLTSAFAKANIIIVILISSLYYGEVISLSEGLGIVFFFAAMVVVNIKVGTSTKETSGKWFLILLACILLLAFRNGGLKVVNEMALSGVLVIAFAYIYCAVYFAAVLIKKRGQSAASKETRKKSLIYGSSCGFVSFGGLYFYVTALKTGPGGVVVTIFSLDMFFILIMSYIFFGERLNRNQKIGFALSAIGLVLIGLK